MRRISRKEHRGIALLDAATLDEIRALFDNPGKVQWNDAPLFERYWGRMKAAVYQMQPAGWSLRIRTYSRQGVFKQEYRYMFEDDEMLQVFELLFPDITDILFEEEGDF